MSNKPWYLENYKKKFSSRSTLRIIPRVEAALAEETALRNAKRDTVHLHPSEMAKNAWCTRSTWYKINGFKESEVGRMDLRRMNILAEGNNIHDKWQRLMWSAGSLYGSWACKECSHVWDATSPSSCPRCLSPLLSYKEVAISNADYRVIGHADGVWEDDEGKAVVEIKSVGLGTLRWEAPALYKAYEDKEVSLDDLWDRLKRPLTSHLKQVNLYMYFLGIHKGIVLYEWKPSQEVKEFHVTLNMNMVTPLLEKAQEVLDSLESGEVPSRPDEAPYKGCEFCRFCSYKSTCWSADD